jgi:hypothetical protein
MASRKPLPSSSDDEEQSDAVHDDSRSSQHHGEQKSSPLQQQQQQLPLSGPPHIQYSTIHARSSPHMRQRMSPGNHPNPAMYGYPPHYPPHQYGPPQLISARTPANAVTPDSRSFLPPDMMSPPAFSARKRTVLTPGSAMSSKSISPTKTGRNQGT